jgi:hypothetical protein
LGITLTTFIIVGSQFLSNIDKRPPSLIPRSKRPQKKWDSSQFFPLFLAFSHQECHYLPLRMKIRNWTLSWVKQKKFHGKERNPLHRH